MEKMIKSWLYTFMVCCLFSGSVHCGEELSFSSITDFFSNSPKPTQKSTQKLTQNPSSPLLSSYNSSPISQSQEKITDPAKRLSLAASKFLQLVPRAREEMANLERQFCTQTPEHPLSQRNMSNKPKPSDWRVLMETSVEGGIKKFPTVEETLERVKKNQEKEKELKNKLQASTLSSSSNPDVEERFKIMSKKLEILEKKLARKNNPQTLTLSMISNGIDDNKLKQMLGTLNIWFCKTINPSDQFLDKYFQDFSHFTLWWTELRPVLMSSTRTQLLYDQLVLYSQLVSREGEIGGVGEKIQKYLDSFLAESLLSKSKSLFEERLPIFLDLKTASDTLKKLKNNTLWEEAKRKEILQNKSLYVAIEKRIAQTLKLEMDRILEECLQYVTAEKNKEAIRDAIQETLNQVVDNGVANSIEKESLKSSKGSEVKTENLIIPFKAKLLKDIVNAISQSIIDALKQAKGNRDKDGQVNPNRSYWKMSSNSTRDFPVLDEQNLTVNIATIMKTIREFVKPLEQAPPDTWSAWWYGPTAVTPILVSIPDDVKQQLTIPSHRPIKRDKEVVSKTSSKLPKKHPKVDTPKISFEESQKQYESIPLPDSDIEGSLAGVFKEILSLRGNRIISVKRHIKNFQQPNTLQEFFERMNSVQMLYDLPRAYAYAPGRRAENVHEKNLQFFKEIEALMDSYRWNLQKTAKSDLGVFLDLGSKLGAHQGYLGPFFDAFPSLDNPELKSGWIKLEVVNLLESNFKNEEERKSLDADLEENLRLLSVVDNFTVESLQFNSLDIKRLILRAKKVLLFKVKCEAIKANKPIPLEKDSEQPISDSFDVMCGKTVGVTEAIKRMADREGSKPQREDKSFKEDHNLLVPFFTELFRKNLTESLSEFGVTDEELNGLKKVSSTLGESSGNSKITLHVPVNLTGNKSKLPKRRAQDDSNLPLLRRLDSRGNITSRG